jgi:hypothetical protein
LPIKYFHIVSRYRLGNRSRESWEKLLPLL